MNGNRYDGEIVLNMDQLVKNDSKRIAVSNGLKFVIPLLFESPNEKNPKTYTLYNELESLMPDFWQFEMEAAKSYVPTDPKTGLPTTFDLDGFIKRALSEKTDYMFYLGSETTPPCSDNVFYIMPINPVKIASCQFKIFREASLLTNKDRVSHARKIQKNEDGGKIATRNLKQTQVE